MILFEEIDDEDVADVLRLNNFFSISRTMLRTDFAICGSMGFCVDDFLVVCIEIVCVFTC